MGEEHWKQLVEEAEVAQTGDYIDLGVLWAKARIAHLEARLESEEAHYCRLLEQMRLDGAPTTASI